MDKIEFQFFKSLQDWMSSPDPVALLRVRIENGWLRDHLPEVHALYGVPQVARWHPEVDTGQHTEMVLAQAAQLTPDPAVRFAALVHDLGKGLTRPDLLPKHPGHEAAGLPLVDQVCDRFEVPDSWRELALLVCGFHLHAHRALELSARGVARFFREAGFHDKPALLDPFLTACLADKRGRTGMEAEPYPQLDFLRVAFQHAHVLTDVDPNRLTQKRVEVVAEVRAAFAG
jgi:tRNA nucleotidyltransferase (CCA-adding enzyme)